MQCISPILVKGYFVPCGQCNFCLGRKRSDWSFRLKQELKQSVNSNFLTLTYTDEQVPVSEDGCQTLETEHMDLFIKTLRDYQRRKTKGLPLRYYTVGEYGTKTERPHYHSIMFNMERKTVEALPMLWDKGFVHIGDVTGASIGYVTKYVINRPGDHIGRLKPFARMSKGLGINYVKSNKHAWHRDVNGESRFYVMNDGQPLAMPRYYQEKIFTKHDREKHRKELQEKLPQAYWEAVSELEAYSANPETYYEESLRARHEAIKVKCNENDTF